MLRRERTVIQGNDALRERQREYEFNQEENTLLRSLASAMAFVGVATVVMGGLLVIGALWLNWTVLNPVRWRTVAGKAVLTGLPGVLLVAMGILTIRSSAHFRAIAITVGNDVTHLMEALTTMCCNGGSGFSV